MTGSISIPAFHGISATKSTDVPTFTIPNNGKPMFEFFQSTGISEEASCRLQGIATPQYNSDAANKQYVDSMAGGININPGTTKLESANIYYQSFTTNVSNSDLVLCSVFNTAIYEDTSQHSSISSTFLMKRGTMNNVVMLQLSPTTPVSTMTNVLLLIDFMSNGDIIFHQNSNSKLQKIYIQIFIQSL